MLKTKKAKQGELSEVLLALRQFNEMGRKAIENLTAAASDLERRVAQLEQFQKTLEQPGVKGEAN